MRVAANRDQVAQQVRSIVAEILNIFPGRVDETSTWQSLEADGFNIEVITQAIRKRLQVEATTDDIESCRTIDDIIDYLMGQPQLA